MVASISAAMCLQRLSGLQQVARWAAAASGACGRARGMSQGETWSMSMTDAGAKGKQRPGTDSFIMRSEGGTEAAWAATGARPCLGTWPQVENGVASPNTVKLPDPDIFMKEDRRAIIGGVSDMTMMEQYDEVKGSGDLGDNAGTVMGMTAP